MSEPRHAMIYRDGYKKQWWLEMVACVWDHLSFEESENSDDDYDRCALSHNASTWGPFASAHEAQVFADANLQNPGFLIGVLDPNVFQFMAPPYVFNILGRPDESYWHAQYDPEEEVA